MSARICVVEDAGWRDLLPLVHMRPVYDLRLGMTTLRDKVRRTYPEAQVFLQCRHYLVELERRRPGRGAVGIPGEGPCLLVSGAVVAGPDLADGVPVEGPANVAYVAGDTVVAARVDGEVLRRVRDAAAGPRIAVEGDADPGEGAAAAPDAPPASDAGWLDLSRLLDDLPKEPVDVPVVRFPWELVHRNGAAIEADFRAMREVGVEGHTHSGCHLIHPERIHVGEATEVAPNVVLDATDGPVCVGRDAEILPGALIRGPTAVGDGSVVRAHARIYGGTTLGPVTKAAGEITETIVQGFSNKQHEGHLGHAYLGEWVNLGAGTDNSDLKNNYSPVRVTVDGRVVESGELFVGAFMGDHVKTGIGTTLNTGTVIGTASNVFGPGYPPKHIPAFAWGGAAGFETYRLDDCVETARRVMARRDVEMTPAYERALRTVHELTEAERSAIVGTR